MNQQDVEIYETIGGAPKQSPVPEPREPKENGFGKGFLVGILTTLVLLMVVWGGMTLGKVVYNRIVQNGSAGAIGTENGQIGTGSKKDGYMDMEGLLDEATVSKISELEFLLQNYYLFDYTKEELQEGILKGMIDVLGDPYTVYYNEEETEELNMSNSGVYYGIGAVLTQNMDTMIITVTQVYKKAPAYEAGLQYGDIILKVDDIDVAGMEVSKAVTYIRGEEGTDVTLTILRDEQEMEITVTRRKVEMESVEYEMLENQTGYIKVTGFEEVTLDQFRTALEDLKAQGMTGVIFDLRNNPGGLLDVCCDMLDELLPEGLLVYTEDKNGRRTDYNSEGDDEFGLPIVILVNENSASASEIFTGALRDRADAIVVGTTSYGKGIVQSIMDLGDGTSFKVTISEYYTPNGTEIHKIGIDPDYEVNTDEESETGDDVDAPLNKALEILGAAH